MAAGFLREVVRTYHERQPSVLVHIREGASAEQIALVRNSQLDVAFVLGTPDLPNCEVTRLWAEHIYVAMPQGHALCGHDQVTWTSLRDEQIILRHSELGRAMHDQLIKQLAEFGSAVRVERLDVSHETLMHLVAMGWGVSLTTEAAIATQFPEVAFRPVAGDAVTIPFSAVWLRNNDNPAFQRFRSLAREMSTKWERRQRDVVALAAPKHQKKKSNDEPRHSHVVRTKARRTDIKRQRGRSGQLDRSEQAPARGSKRGPAKRR